MIIQRMTVARRVFFLEMVFIGIDPTYYRLGGQGIVLLLVDGLP